MIFPKELLGKWDDIDRSKLKGTDPKFFNRNLILRQQFNLLSQHIPEFLRKGKGKSVVDISAGSGALLEIMRHYGYKVQGLDISKDTYYEFLKSKNIPCIFHDCKTFPYPIKSKSYNVLTNNGAITFYKPFNIMWPKVLNEFGRIAKDCILVIANTGPLMRENRFILKNWENDDFKLSYTNNNNIYKWTKR